MYYTNNLEESFLTNGSTMLTIIAICICVMCIIYYFVDDKEFL